MASSKLSHSINANSFNEDASRKDKRNQKLNSGKGVSRNPRSNDNPKRMMDLGGGNVYDSREAGGRQFGRRDIKQLNEEENYGMGRIRNAAKANKENLGAGAQIDLGIGVNKNTFKDLDNYDTTTVGLGKRGKDLQGPEIKELIKEHGAKAVNKSVKARGLTMNKNAQDKLNKSLARLGANKTDITAEPGDVPGQDFINTDPADGGAAGEPIAPPITTPTTRFPTNEQSVVADQDINQDLEQIVGSDKMKDNIFNVDNTGMIGNSSIGNDMSVNINSGRNNANQTAANNNNQSGIGLGLSGGAGAMGFEDLGLDNIASGAATMGLLNNALHRSQANMSGLGRGAQASAAAGAITGASDRIAALDYSTLEMPHAMGKRSDAYALDALGDIDNPNFANRKLGGYTFERSEDPEMLDYDPEELARQGRAGLDF